MDGLLYLAYLDWLNRSNKEDEWSGAGLDLWWTDWPDPVMGANAELARLIDDVQKNRNRGD